MEQNKNRYEMKVFERTNGEPRKLSQDTVVAGLKFIAEHRDISQDKLVDALLDLGCDFTLDDVTREIEERNVHGNMRDGIHAGEITAGASVVCNMRDDVWNRNYGDEVFLENDDAYSIYHYIRTVTKDPSYTKKNIRQKKIKEALAKKLSENDKSEKPQQIETPLYPKVNVQEYVKKGLESGVLEPFEAEKFARVEAVQGYVGEEVISWSEDKNGNAIKERVNSVGIDEKTQENDWIVTKLDENGEFLRDKNGHPNQWIVKDSKFKAKYELDPENSTLYRPIFKPTGGPQTFVEIPEGITLEQWGKEMAIDAGGFINITDPKDMYGISKRDFEDTYKKVQTLNKKSLL